MRLPWTLALVVATCACNLRTVSVGEEPHSASEKVLESVADGAYLSSPSFAHATAAPYTSTAAKGAKVDEWVSADAWSEYARISPDATGSGAKVPVGTTIVRAVLDSRGATTKLTLMAKGPPGYNPDLGDWWFGETDPYGAPMEDDAGAMTGRMSECYSCHLARAHDDFLFGVPTDVRAPPR